jgi:hypothetical protein
VRCPKNLRAKAREVYVIINITTAYEQRMDWILNCLHENGLQFSTDDLRDLEEDVNRIQRGLLYNTAMLEALESSLESSRVMVKRPAIIFPGSLLDNK